MKALITGGIGDWFVTDSHWDDATRAVLTDIYLATSRAAYLKELIRAVRDYNHVEIHELQDRVFEHFIVSDLQNEQEVREHFKDLPSDIKDFSLRKVWKQEYDTFYGSTYLKRNLTVPFLTKDMERLPYIVICPASIHGRTFTLMDWQRVRAFLHTESYLGVILYKGEIKIKKDPYFEDLTNRTSLLESIEILKHPNCCGYIGVDSCLAVLASQLFYPEGLVVVSNNPQYMEFAGHYCAPHKDFPFVVEGLRF